MVDCPLLRVLVVVEDSLWQTVRLLFLGCLLCRILADAPAGSLLGCPLFACVVHHLFYDRLGVPTGSRYPGFACFRRGSIYSVFGGGSPRVVSRTLLSSF